MLQPILLGFMEHFTFSATGMRILLTCGLSIPIIACGQAGTLDQSFDQDGIVSVSVASISSAAHAVAIQPDGRIVAGGYAMNGSQYDFAVLRFMQDGSLDNSFGNNGIVLTAVGESSSQGRAMVLQPDGKILLAGTCVDDGLYSAAVVRYENDGELDATFGSAGIVITSIGPAGDEVNAMALQPDGKILIAGGNYGTIRDMALARYHSDGTLDQDFGLDGKVVVSVYPEDEVANALVIQNDGRIIVAGTITYDMFGSGSESYSNFILARFTSDGSLDPSFGTGGFAETDFGSDHEAGSAIALQSDQKILVAGTTGVPFALDMALLRYDPAGVLDGSFGVNGLRTTSIGSGNDGAAALVVQSNDKIILAGYTDNGSDTDLALVCYEPNGELANTFGSNGIVVTPASVDSSEFAQALAVQSDGKLVAAGGLSTQGFQGPVLARYFGDTDMSIPNSASTLATFRLYPSPTDAYIVLEYELSKAQRITFELMDIEGRLGRSIFTSALRTTGMHRETIDLTGFSSGSYTLILSAPTGVIAIPFVKR